MQKKQPKISIKNLDVVMAFDPSVSDSKTSSLRAIAVVGMDSEQRVFLLDTYAGRDVVDKVLDKIFELNGKWHPRSFGIESVALSRIYLNLLQKECQIRKKWVSAVPLKVPTNRSKESRIRDAIQSLAANGRLYIQRHQGSFIEEYMDFPQGRTNDLVDAVSMAISMLRVPLSEEEEDEMDRIDEKILMQRSAITGC